MPLQFISEADESRLLTEVMTADSPHLRLPMFSISDLRPPGDNVANPHEAAAPDVRRRASLRWNRPAAVAAFPACNRERSTMSAHCSPRVGREEAGSEACHSFAQLLRHSGSGERLVATRAFPHGPNHVLLNEYSDGCGIDPHNDGPLYASVHRKMPSTMNTRCDRVARLRGGCVRFGGHSAWLSVAHGSLGPRSSLANTLRTCGGDREPHLAAVPLRPSPLSRCPHYPRPLLGRPHLAAVPLSRSPT